MTKTFWETTAELSIADAPFVIITLVSARGHAPQDPGAKAIVGFGGLLWGTVGGGKVEARAIQWAQEKLRSSEKSAPELITWNLQKDIGMTCGGEVIYLFETHFHAEWKIAVFGAGHVGQALVRLLDTLDCKITCIDSREEWLNKIPTSEKIKTVLLQEPASFVEKCNAQTYFLSITQGHASDVPILAEIFRCFPEAPYIGVIGSITKGGKIRSELLERGIASGFIEKLRCPIGLSLGTNHPGEIPLVLSPSYFSNEITWQPRPRKSTYNPKK